MPIVYTPTAANSVRINRPARSIQDYLAFEFLDYMRLDMSMIGHYTSQSAKHNSSNCLVPQFATHNFEFNCATKISCFQKKIRIEGLSTIIEVKKLFHLLLYSSHNLAPMFKPWRYEHTFPHDELIHFFIEFQKF